MELIKIINVNQAKMETFTLCGWRVYISISTSNQFLNVDSITRLKLKFPEP